MFQRAHQSGPDSFLHVPTVIEFSGAMLAELFPRASASFPSTVSGSATVVSVCPVTTHASEVRTLMYRTVRKTVPCPKAEVQQFRPRLCDHHVPGLQVTVNDPGSVRSGKRIGNLNPVLEGLVERQLATREPGSQRFRPPRTPSRGSRPVLMADVEQRADVGCESAATRAGLTLRSLPSGGVGRQVWWEA